MVQGNNYRLLHLKQLLFNETDENHELNLQQITEKLISILEVDRIDHRTIRSDLDSLQAMDFDIVENRRAHGKIYYSHQAKLFETYQLRLLVDAILSARFITPREKRRLIAKIKELTSTHIRKTLPEPIMFSKTVNEDYEMIKLNIDRVHQAMTSSHVLRYQYGDYNVRKEFTYRREGDWYIVEPYALIWQNDLYYLIGKYRAKNEMRHYRLDRMRNIEITAERFIKDRSFELQPYVDNSFQMFSGEEKRIKIRFHMDLLNPMYDRFGLDVDVTPDGPDHFMLKTKAKISEGLLGWILQWGASAEVISPEGLLESVRKEVQKMAEKYEDS